MNNSYKRLDRKSNSTLEDAHLRFFHKLIVAIENDKEIKDKIVKNFSNLEVKNIINKGKQNSYSITINPLDYPSHIGYDEFRFTDNKNNKAFSLLYHLRNAFAHNRVQLEKETLQLMFQDEYKKKINMVGKCNFLKLKYLVETILGEHNMTEEEKKMYKKKNRNNKRKQSNQKKKTKK